MDYTFEFYIGDYEFNFHIEKVHSIYADMNVFKNSEEMFFNQIELGTKLNRKQIEEHCVENAIDYLFRFHRNDIMRVLTDNQIIKDVKYW